MSYVFDITGVILYDFCYLGSVMLHKSFCFIFSDYWRGDILIRYGGIYMDWDVMWVNPIPEDLRRYETVACADFPATGAFPDVFNMGVLLAAKGSKYLRFFLESYHHYLDSHWSYNAIHMPYKVYEKHPDLLLVNRHLQVRSWFIIRDLQMSKKCLN